MFSIFNHTETETEAFNKAKAYEEALNLRKQDLRTLSQSRGYGQSFSEDNKARYALLEQEIANLTAALETLMGDENLQTGLYKSRLNKELASKLPGGNPMVILRLAEEVVALLDSDFGKRAKSLLLKLSFRALYALADSDLNSARAAITAARYIALKRTGMPVELINQIMVAEASVPMFPAISLGRK